MKALCSTIAGILIAVIFVSALCAQACFDPNPVSSCPAHHTKDCCKHEDGSSEQVRADSFGVVNLQQSVVHLPMQMVHSIAADLQIPIATFDRFKIPPGYAPHIAPADVPLALRI